MNWVLILFLASSGAQVEAGKYKTLAECEAAGQHMLRGQRLLVTFSNYACKQRGVK